MIVEKKAQNLAWLIINYFADSKNGWEIEQAQKYEQVCLLDRYIITLNLN